MVARHHKDPNVGVPKTPQPFHEIEAGVVVLPVTVIYIAGQQDKCDLFINRKFDQIVEGTTGCTTDLLHGRAFIALQAMQGTVEVDVCGVEEFQRIRFHIVFRI